METAARAELHRAVRFEAECRGMVPAAWPRTTGSVAEFRAVVSAARHRAAVSTVQHRAGASEAERRVAASVAEHRVADSTAAVVGSTEVVDPAAVVDHMAADGGK